MFLLVLTEKAICLFFNRSDVKAALHVPDSIKWDLCNDKFQTTYNVGTKGSFYLYPRLIQNNLRIWIYSGDTDGAVPFNGTRAWIQNLQLPVVTANRSWRITNDEVAGYVTVYQGLTFVTVKGVGHMVPQWKRAEAFYMFGKYLTGDKL